MLLKLRAESSQPQDEQSERGSLDRPEATVLPARDDATWDGQDSTSKGVEETCEGGKNPGPSWVPSTSTRGIEIEEEVETKKAISNKVVLFLAEFLWRVPRKEETGTGRSKVRTMRADSFGSSAGPPHYGLGKLLDGPDAG